MWFVMKIKKRIVVVLLFALTISTSTIYYENLAHIYKVLRSSNSFPNGVKLPEGYQLLFGKTDGLLIIVRIKNNNNQYYTLKNVSYDESELEVLLKHCDELDSRIILCAHESGNTLLWIIDGRSQLATSETSPFSHKLYPKELIDSIRLRAKFNETVVDE